MACSKDNLKVAIRGHNSGLLDYNNTVGGELSLCLYMYISCFNKKLLACVAKITANKPVSCDLCHFIQHIHYVNDRQGTTAER